MPVSFCPYGHFTPSPPLLLLCHCSCTGCSSFSCASPWSAATSSGPRPMSSLPTSPPARGTRRCLIQTPNRRRGAPRRLLPRRRSLGLGSDCSGTRVCLCGQMTGCCRLGGDTSRSSGTEESLAHTGLAILKWMKHIVFAVDPDYHLFGAARLCQSSQHLGADSLQGGRI